MTQPPSPADGYVGGEVQIGGGFGGMKPLAQHGTVAIAQGVLTLYDTNGGVIDSAPLTGVEVSRIKMTMGQSVYAVLNGKKYSLSVGHGQRMHAADLVLGGGLVGGLGQMADAKAGTAGFIAAFEALSGKTV